MLSSDKHYAGRSDYSNARGCVVFTAIQQFHTVFTPVGNWKLSRVGCIERRYKRKVRKVCLGKVSFLESAEGQIHSEM